MKATEAIRLGLSRYRRPAIMCSFGKDSMVMLHLIRAASQSIPVIFYSDPWFPEKYAFAQKIIREWGLESHDYPPSAVSLWEGKEIMAFTNHYQIGDVPGAVLQLPKNILPPEKGKRFLCGLKQVLGRPTGSFRYPWDAVFIGHKSSDKDQIAGEVPLNCDVKQNAGVGPDAIFPLRAWTDDDIWDYTERFAIPQQEDRYDVANRKEREDKTTNSDYAHVCIACCDRRDKRVSVPCPMMGGLEVTNVSAQVPYASPSFNYYGSHAAT